MEIFCQIMVFILVALVAATQNCSASTVTLYMTMMLSTATITAPSEVKNTITSASHIIIMVTNKLGNDVSFSFGSNVDGLSSVSNPSFTALLDNGFTHYIFPTDWAG